MYNSSKLHKNQALFTQEGYTSIGDKYGTKQKKDSRFGGKQFAVGRSKRDTFGEFQPLSVVPNKPGKSGYASDPYDSKVKREPFHSVKPYKKSDLGLSFGSKDSRAIVNTTKASKCFREKLDMEARAARRTLATTGASTLSDIPSLQTEAAAPALTLYDRTIDQDDDLLRNIPRKGAARFGSMRTSANMVGTNVADGLNDPSRAKYSRVNVCKEFYNSGAVDASGPSKDFMNM